MPAGVHDHSQERHAYQAVNLKLYWSCPMLGPTSRLHCHLLLVDMCRLALRHFLGLRRLTSTCNRDDEFANFNESWTPDQPAAAPRELQCSEVAVVTICTYTVESINQSIKLTTATKWCPPTCCKLRTDLTSLIRFDVKLGQQVCLPLQ